MSAVYWFLPSLSSGVRERWPYGPGTTFRPSLAVELDAAERAANPVIAPVDGWLVVVPEASTTKCGIMLLPTAEVTEDLRLDGIGEVAFYFHSLDLKDFLARYKTAATKRLKRGVTAEKQLEDLAKGTFTLRVDAGDDLALVAAGTDDKGLLEVEVPFAPRRGSYVGKGRGLGYAMRLADPAKRRRRMDPMTFYYRVKRRGSKATIAPSHATHAFWSSTSLSKRGLIEMRDEYDRPFATTLDVDVDGTVASVTLTSANWAHHEVAASGTTGLVDVTLGKASWIFTPLPSGSLSKALPTTQDEPPFHWAVQSIYMGTTAGNSSWFVDNAAPLSFFTKRNTVTPLVDGKATFIEMVDWMKRVRGLEKFMWLAGWWGDSDFEMIPLDFTSKLKTLTTDIDASKAEVRVILWEQAPASPGRSANEATVNHVEALTYGYGILDGQTTRYGSHHQKFMLAYVNPGEAAAFCGGIDVNPNRLDDPKHNDKYAYHDTHAKLQGPAGQDFMRLFVERWNDHGSTTPSRKARDANYQFNETTGDCYVQVTRTIPKGTHPSVIGGVQGSYNAVLRAVQRAQNYIYIEDQYLVPYWGKIPFDATKDRGIVQALIDALDRIKFLLMVIPNNLMTYQVKGRRHEFLQALKQAAGANASKIHTYYLKRPKPKKKARTAMESEVEEARLHNQETEITAEDKEDEEYMDALGGQGASGGWPYLDEIYVHTKVWIVDDIYVKCGSMNFNRRGFTYDTEADFHAVDGALYRGKRRTALAFRNALFSEHGRKDVVDVPDDAEDLINWWLDRASRSKRVGVYDHARHKFKGGSIKRWRLDQTWNRVIDPDGS